MPGWPVLEKPMSDKVDEREIIFLRLVLESKWCETNKTWYGMEGVVVSEGMQGGGDGDIADGASKGRNWLVRI